MAAVGVRAFITKLTVHGG